MQYYLISANIQQWGLVQHVLALSYYGQSLTLAYPLPLILVSRIVIRNIYLKFSTIHQKYMI